MYTATGFFIRFQHYAANYVNSSKSFSALVIPMAAVHLMGLYSNLPAARGLTAVRLNAAAAKIGVSINQGSSLWASQQQRPCYFSAYVYIKTSHFLETQTFEGFPEDRVPCLDYPVLKLKARSFIPFRVMLMKPALLPLRVSLSLSLYLLSLYV